MSSILLCGFSSTGTAEDLVTVAEELIRRGHQVTVVAGAQAEAAYAALEVSFVTVPEAALPLSRLRRPPFRERVREIFEHVQKVYVEPSEDQWRVVRKVLVEARVELVLTDGLFFGAAFLAYLPRASRPPVVDLGMFPLSVSDPTVPAYGFGIPPIDSLATRLQAFGLSVAAARPYLQLTRAFSMAVERLTGVRPEGDIRDAIRVADVWAQLTVECLEYPRTAIPANVQYYGALRPAAYGAPPDWWDPSDPRQVIAVLSDTGADLEDLVLPTLEAFGRGDAVVVVSGASRAQVAPRRPDLLGASVHFEESMPWEYLRRERTVVVSTGDYVHTHYALQYGLPVVAAGTFGHQVEMAARIAWAGAGIDLRTRRPRAADIREAVGRILGDEAVLAVLARVASQLAKHNAEAALGDLVDELTSTAASARHSDRSPVGVVQH